MCEAFPWPSALSRSLPPVPQEPFPAAPPAAPGAPRAGHSHPLLALRGPRRRENSGDAKWIYLTLIPVSSCHTPTGCTDEQQVLRKWINKRDLIHVFLRYVHLKPLLFKVCFYFKVERKGTIQHLTWKQ